MNGKVKDLTGQRFGKLKVVEYTGRTTTVGKNAIWLCKCDCGKLIEVRGTNLTNKKRPQKSCGCATAEIVSLSNTTHGGSKERLYKVWMCMRRRCYEKSNKDYQNYGGRGVGVCDEWQNYDAFREWAIANGYDPNAKYHQCTIDRIDVDGDYSPDNCRWADMKTQSNNKRKSKLIEHNGKSQTLRTWSEELGFNYMLVKDRLRRGWTFERAIAQSVQVHQKRF